ncbi:MAG: hypothetical protein ACR2PL_05170 [Dehalococcoidia bacterium]
MRGEETSQEEVDALREEIENLRSAIDSLHRDLTVLVFAAGGSVEVTRETKEAAQKYTFYTDKTKDTYTEIFRLQEIQ